MSTRRSVGRAAESAPQELAPSQPAPLAGPPVPLAGPPVAAAPPAAVIDEIDRVVSMVRPPELMALRMVERAARMATAIARLRELITPSMVDSVMALQNTALGFLTDKEAGYDAQTVRDCLIEALLRGASWVGGEFCIIAGRCYLTRAYFARAVREWPGLTNLELLPGVPTMAGEGGALVPYRARWKLNGQQHELARVRLGPDEDYRVPVRMNRGMGVDAAIGKATRKVLAMIYERLLGGVWVVPEGEPDDLPAPAAGGGGVERTLERIGGPVAQPAQQQAADALFEGNAA